LRQCWDAVISSNKAVFRGVGIINPAVVCRYVFFPLPCFAGIYSEAKKFMQFTYRGQTGGESHGFGMNFNQELLNGIGAIIADMYWIGGGGTIIRRAGTGDTTLDATTWSLVSGDVLRFTSEVTATTVIIKAYKNGVLTLQATDSAATRITKGTGCLIGELLSGTPSLCNWGMNNFSYGKGLL
jgi:hypothetical protein